MPTLESEKTDVDMQVEDVQAEVDAIVEASARVREQLSEISAEVDRTGDASRAMEIAWSAGIHRLCIPRELGGLSNGSMLFQLEAATKALLNIGAGEQSVGQMVGTQFLLLREAFSEHSAVPQSVKEEIARSVLAEETRLWGAGNATGLPGNGLIFTRVEGGVKVNGTIGFATQSEGERGIIQCIGWIRSEDSDEWEMGMGFTRHGDEGVRPHRDWENMGQRATGSGKVTFEDVFIEDGRWANMTRHGAGGIGGTTSFSGYPAIAIMMLGMGLGAYEAELAYVRTMERGAWPLFDSPKDDVTMHIRLAKHRAALDAARALVLQAARETEHSGDNADALELRIQADVARDVATEAALYVAADMFELTGARSTASKYDLDRFWRNIRTLSTHDPADFTRAVIGFYTINRSLPPIAGKRFGLAFRKPTTATA